MAENKDANKKHYFQIADKAEKISSLTNAISSGVSLHLWKKGQTTDDLEEYSILELDKDTLVLKLKQLGGLLAKLSKSKLIGGDIFFKYTVNKLQYFSYALLDHNGTDYTLVVSNDLYKSQQRTNYRLTSSRHVQIQLKIGDQVFDALDASAGGTSFIVGEETAESFKEGVEFKEVTFRLNRYQTIIPLIKIVKVWPIRDQEGELTGEAGLGVAFIDLPKNTEEDFFKEINSEARAEEIRKKMTSKNSM